MQINKYNYLNLNALLLVLLIFMGPLSLPINEIMGNGIVVWIATAIIIIISLISNKKINYYFIIICLILVSGIFINIILVNHKDIVISKFMEIIKFAIIPMYIASNRFNYEAFKKYICLFSYISIIILVLFIPAVIDKKLEYMQFGVYLTYCFIGFILAIFSYEKYRIINFIMSIITLIIIGLFGNRGSLLICIGIILFNTIYIKRINLKDIIIRVSIIFIIILTYINSYNILININNILNDNNISSYSINKYIMAFESGLEQSSSGRSDIYDETIEIIREANFKPNGIGYYTYKTGKNYPHNFILDILIVFGIYGAIIISTISIIMLIKTIKDSNPDIRFYIILLTIYVIFRLLLSGTFINEEMLWVLIGLVISIENKKNKVIKLY